MKIVFIGTVEFSLKMLTALLENDIEIAGVITAKNTGANTDFADLLPACDKYNIPIQITADINSSETLEWIAALNPDVVFCFGWSRLIKQQLLHLAPLGVIGYHPTALPQNRGRHPLIWALVLGLKKTASTFFFMNEWADSGDILSQREIDITDADDATSLYEKVTNVAKSQLLVMIPELANGQFQRREQDHTKANVWRKREVSDGVIDWRMNASAVNNIVCGLARPYVGAHFNSNGQEHKVWKSRVVSHPKVENIEPGKVIQISDNQSVIVKCADTCIELIEVDPPLQLSPGEYL